MFWRSVKALRSLFPMWAGVHALWKYLKPHILFSFKMLWLWTVLLIASKSISTCSQTSLRAWHILISGFTGSSYEVGLSSRCSLASLEPAWMPQTCIWRAMWEQTALTQGASSTSKHLSKTSDDCLFFLCRWNSQFPFSIHNAYPKKHYNKDIVIINSNVWSGLIFFFSLCRSPAQQFMIILISSGSTVLCLWYFVTFCNTSVGLWMTLELNVCGKKL